MEPNDFKDIFDKILNQYGTNDIETMIGKYLERTEWSDEDYEEYEPTEEEIHAERSERFIEGKHIVCPFEGYEEEEEDDNIFDDEPMGIEDTVDELRRTRLDELRRSYNEPNDNVWGEYTNRNNRYYEDYF